MTSHKAPLSTRQPFQGTLCGTATHLCLFLLEGGTGFGVATANMIGVPAT
ncbi:MAG: hypothetical protein ACU4EQ_01635 [Candidatus Nitrosoglobus sp.]